MTKKETYKKEVVNGNTIVTVGKIKVFLNTIQQNSLLKAMEFNQQHFDFVSFYTTGERNKNEIIYVSALNKGMSAHNWMKFFKVFGISSDHPMVKAIMALANALANGEAIKKLEDVPNNQVASSPTANLNLKDLAVAMKEEIIFELKKEANK
jgi:hypothetical protein